MEVKKDLQKLIDKQLARFDTIIKEKEEAALAAAQNAQEHEDDREWENAKLEMERQAQINASQKAALERLHANAKVETQNPNANLANPNSENRNKIHPNALLESSPCKDANRPKIIAIGASTGGVDALNHIFKSLPKGLPPIVVVQHIPKLFGSSFAKRLNTSSQLDVFEVTQKMQLQDSCGYLAQGESHMFIGFESGKYYAKPIEGTRISRHRPSVDILFRSVNNCAGKAALAVIMTGMGDDGCIGMKELFDNGAQTIAQDEKSCVVFGMPKKAIEVGAAKHTLSLDAIIQHIIDFGTQR